MTSITIKNIPDELYERLKAAAAANRRSINSEVLVVLEEAVGAEQLDVDSLLAHARRLRSLTTDYPLTEAKLAELKNSGRP